MTTPATPQKRFFAAGAKKATTWGEAVALGAGFAFDIKEDGDPSNDQPYIPSAEADSPIALGGDLGPIPPVDFAPAFTMRYDPTALGILIAQLFGTAGTPGDEGEGAYMHTLVWADENIGKFSTFAVERRSSIFEVPTVKPYMLDFSIAEGFLEGSIGLRGNTFINTSTTNQATQMDALTYRNRDLKIKFSDISIKMNNQVDGALSGENVLEVSDLSIHYERPHDGIHGAGSESIIEPQENGKPIVTVALTFPRMDAVNAAYFASCVAKTPQKLQIEATSPSQIGSSYYFFRQYFPRMKFVPPVRHPFGDIITTEITLQMEKAATPPTGMGQTVPFITWLNARAADYLT